MRSDHLSKHLKTHQARRNQGQTQQIQVQVTSGEENALIISQTDIGLDGESNDNEKPEIVTREMVGQISV